MRRRRVSESTLSVAISSADVAPHGVLAVIVPPAIRSRDLVRLYAGHAGAVHSTTPAITGSKQGSHARAYISPLYMTVTFYFYFYLSNSGDAGHLS